LASNETLAGRPSDVSGSVVALRVAGSVGLT